MGGSSPDAPPLTLSPFLENGPESAPLTLVLAHGAGAPMDSPFMDAMADGIAALGWRVVRFEFPYMALRRTAGTKRPPDRAPALLDCWRAVIGTLGPAERLVIGGKSMGGRMASLIADECGVAGLVCLGFPFHGAGKPETAAKRTAHLEELTTPTLICQGTRDPMGGKPLVDSLPLAPAIAVHWLEDGDHSFKPRKSSGLTESDTLQAAVHAVHGHLRAVAK